MSLLKKNIAANFSGNIWQGLMGLAFVPLYIKFMGIESYGLIGVFATLQGMFAILDFGLGATLTREIARLAALPYREQEIRDLLKSLEIIYWGIAVFIGGIVIALAPFIAHHWVKASHLSPQAMEQAIRIMGFVMALQWPASLYTGGLMGLQRQVLLNVINAGTSTVRGVGAVLVLWLVSPTIQAFFLWQIIISLINTSLLGFFLWHKLPRSEKRAAFKKQMLLGIWRFAAGMTGISILSTVLTQLDKIILSKMLTLETFGYYTLAGVVSISLYRLIGPISSAVYPRLTELVAVGDQDGLKRLYHKSCQFMSVMILPVAVIIAMFSYEILLLWTRNPVTAQKTHLLLSILICGTAINGLMNIPYALQLAHAWTKLTLYVNFVMIVLLVPSIFFMTKHFGPVGAASVWVILNSCYVLVGIPLMHRCLLVHEKWRWYGEDVGMTLAASLLIASMGRTFMAVAMPQSTMVLYLTAVSFATLVGAALVTPTTRIWLFNKLGIITKESIIYGNAS